MNRLEENQTPPQRGDIDTLLRAFFQTELPHPWPPFHSPQQRKVLPFAAPEPARFAVSSKFALALSVGLLLLCGWLLSGSLSSSRNSTQVPEITGPGTANRHQHKLPMPGAVTEPGDKEKGEIDREQGDPEGGFDHRDLFPNR